MTRPHASYSALILLLALAACTTSDVLEPSAMVGAPPPVAEPLGAVAAIPDSSAPTAPRAGQTFAAVPANARLQFAPIIGAPVEAVTPLTERLVARSRERGITLAASGDPSSTHMLKGYFSAITEARGTTVIYVWDVLDGAGNRLHRIQGQQTVQPGGGDSWRAVPPGAMRAIGDATIDGFAEWLSAPRG
ncbi:MAG: hypothetical protein AB7I79_00515 [Rhizobiaceae bacterium]